MTRIDSKTKGSGRSGAGHLDSVDFAPAAYVDRLFGSEASLEGVDIAIANVRHRHATTTQDIRHLLRQQSAQGRPPDVAATTAGIALLYERISAMKAKARESERTVQDITQDIRALDFAKRNLTAAMTTMKRLQMLVASVEHLRVLGKQQRYREAAQAVLAVNGLREALAGYERVARVAQLGDAAMALQMQLEAEVCGVVEKGFDMQGVLVGDAQEMHDACVCADALGAGGRICEFYSAVQMRAYAALFTVQDDVAQLEHVARRYAWLRRILRNYGDAHAGVFPAAWRVDEHVTRAFATATRDQLAEIMATHAPLEVGHLLQALGDTLAFEAQCDKRFNEPPETFVGAISCAFEPYMSVYIESESAKYAALVRRVQGEPLAADDDAALSVLASSTDILYQYRESLRQCAALTTGAAMLDLARVFDKYLGEYARDVLEQRLPRISADSALADLGHACLIINTADYCASAAAQLEQKLVERISEPLRPQVSFSKSREALLGAANAGMRALVNGAEAMCEPGLAQLSQVSWGSVRAVGDQSSHVLLVASALEAAAQASQRALSSMRYFRTFCDKLAARITQRYLAAIHSARVVSEEGAEQLLLDAQALKAALAAMPGKSPPPAYAKIVATGMGRIEALLKAILAPPDPPDALVDRFLLLYASAPRDVFQQILGLKGIRPADQPTYFRTLSKRLMTDKEKPKPKEPALKEPALKEPTPKEPAPKEPAVRQSPDPLGITGMPTGMSASSSPSEPDDDTSNSPVLASLAANATATRTKINNNLRKLMSNMRRT